jgi:hypothetical protein
VADATLLAINHLLGDADLLTLLGGENVFGPNLPEKFDPTVQPGITVATEGGSNHPEVPLGAARVKVHVWAGINQAVLARQIDSQIVRRLHRQNQVDLSPDGFIVISQQTVMGQDMTDPDEGYATVLSYYEITTRDSSTEEVATDNLYVVDGGSF